MLNLDQLETVNTINARADYDLRYSEKTGKFTLGQDAYVKHNMNDNGFVLLRDKSTNTPVLQLVPNDSANVHPGRGDADQKGKTFTANALKTMLSLDKEPVEFTFNVEEKDGNTYITLESDVMETEDGDDSEQDVLSNDMGEEPNQDPEDFAVADEQESKGNW